MIAFRCPNCRRKFHVPDDLAGRQAKCKSCGTKMVIPKPRSAAPPPTPAAAQLTPRQRRLLADERQLRKAFPDDGSSPIRLKAAAGSPPEKYEIDFHIAGLAPGDAPDAPAQRTQHTALVTLPRDYPRMPPVVAMLTPAYHPNIDPSSVCVGDHWAAGERLCDLVVRVGEMLAYQAYNIRSPLDGEAAMWADLNQGRFPTDPVDLRALTDGL